MTTWILYRTENFFILVKNYLFLLVRIKFLQFTEDILID